MDNYEFCATYIKQNMSAANFDVLDYGCGVGKIVTKLSEKGINAKGCDVFYKGGDRSKLVPTDLWEQKIKKMENGLIPFPDNSFDFVVNNQVFEHVENIDLALSEINRVLRPGGQVLSLFPDRGVWGEGHCGIPFLHWFPKGSRVRVFYAAFLRTIGLGYVKGKKSIWQWSQDFCVYLDKWTWYRSNAEINAAFGQYFSNLTGIEDLWLKMRLEHKAVWVGWLPKCIRQCLVRKIGGRVFVCTKKK